MKCGVYSYKTSQGRMCYYRLSEEFARMRPWYAFVRDVECDARVRFSDGETVPAPPAPMRGAGDLLAAGIKYATFGKVTPCGGCEQRRDFLNKLIPFGGAS